MTIRESMDFLDELILKEIKKVNRQQATIALNARRKLEEKTRTLWDKASVKGVKEDGIYYYVSKNEAYKYNRMRELQKEVRNIAKVGYLDDLATATKGLKDVYDLQFEGFAYVYREGYGLPLTGGVNVKLRAERVNSDFYGATIKDRLQKHWQGLETEINRLVIQGLNTGKPYKEIGESIKGATNKSYNASVRVAKTEAHRVQSMAHLDTEELLKESDVKYAKVWSSAADSRTRSDHVVMDGVEADEDGIFTLPDGSQARAPGLSGEASQDINCRCTYINIIAGLEPPERYKTDITQKQMESDLKK